MEENKNSKISITKEAEEKLVSLLKKVNDGFDSGKVNRQDLATWVLMQFCDNSDDETIQSIRADHFDEFMVLESILKKGREQGQLPSDFKALLRQQLGIGVDLKQKSKKALTKKYTNDVISQSDQS